MRLVGMSFVCMLTVRTNFENLERILGTEEERENLVVSLFVTMRPAENMRRQDFYQHLFVGSDTR